MIEQLEPAAVLTVVGSPACHFCDDAHDALEQIGTEIPLYVDWVDAASPRGEALVREHRAPMLPLVLVDGIFFSFGRLPRKKLRKLLGHRHAQVVA